MQREFKFRSYSEENDAMYHFGLGEWFRGVIMQSTGLKDVKGNLIFEGDIIEFEEPRFESAVIKCEVKFITGSFVAIDENANIIESTEKLYNGKPIYDLHEISELEVIGNIYQNKELLT